MAKIPEIPPKKDIDFEPVNFGKYKGKTPEQISIIDPRYIVWAYEEYGIKFCSKALYVDSIQVNDDE